MCLTISRLLWKNAVGCGIIYKSDWEDTVTIDTEHRTAAAKFAAKDQGDEKQETQRFWVELLTKFFSIDGSTVIAFEVPVKLDYTSFIDGYIESTRFLIEQKGQDIDLRKGYKQSDGSMLTSFGQARRYAGYLLHDQPPAGLLPATSSPLKFTI